MSRFSEITVPIRRSPEYLPPCPLCSHLGHDDFPDIIVGPSIIRSRATGRFGLQKCCPLSESAGWHETEAQVSQCWLEMRQRPQTCIAIDNRRRNSLAKLAAAGLEPL